MLHDAGPLSALADGELRVQTLGRQTVGLLRWGDDVFAVRNSCPHQNGPLCAGSLLGRLESPGVGEVRREARPVLACPWHGWEFDVETGRALWDDRYRVTTFATAVENGRILVEIGRLRG